MTIRPFNMCGPQQIGEGAIHWLILDALKNKDIIVHNEGDQVRSWCYIDDMIVAIVACLEEAQAVNKTFNIGNPRATCTVLDLAQKIIKLSKSKSKIKFQKIKYPDVEIRVPSIKKAEKYLKFHPKIGLEEGLIKTINWYKGHLI